MYRWPVFLPVLIALLYTGAHAAQDYQIDTVAEGLEHPWSIAWLPDGRVLVTERAGRLRMIVDDQLLDDPVVGVPPVFARSQGGLFEVLVDPDFADNRRIYLSFAHGGPDANATRVVRARLEERRLLDLEVLFTAEPAKDTPVHYGGRMALLPDGTLVVGLGDGFDDRERAQTLDNHFGKIVRIARDGSVPADNPFVDRPGARPEIYSYGHRNIQGLVFDPDSGTLWSHEHGPRGGDEVNRIEAGANYGWPVATHGIDYSGARVSPFRSRPGMRDPLRVWTPSIAPSGLAIYRGERFLDWQGDLLVSALVSRDVRRLSGSGADWTEAEPLFGEIDQRLRDVAVAPDGSLFLLTDAADGRVLRVVPTVD
jgi:glucose/arabinose dehydrogenase